MAAETPIISHALVLPDVNFESWLAVVKPYLTSFERVAVIRSPGGNDLNRYRNVTAVQAPKTWFQDDAHAHIRRAYPMVVRVDVIAARTPQELSPIIAERVKNKDRYGEKSNSPVHIYDRFILEYPTDARPARITRPFSTLTDQNPDTHEGIDLYAPPGAKVFAGAAGKVATISTQPTALGYGQYVQISSQMGGLTYLVTYGYLQNIRVKTGQDVAAGAHIADARADGEFIKIVVQNPPGGLSGFALPSIVDPTPMLYWQGIQLRPIKSGLRVRSLPSTDGEIIKQLGLSDILEPLEPHGRTLAKVGREEQWLRVRTADGKEGHTAAWMLEARGKYDPKGPFAGVNITGMNLDIYNRNGRPDPRSLGTIGWVRLKFNVSFNPDNGTYGNRDINAAYNRYRPIYEAYAKAGRKVLVVLTHQLFGEGAGYNWNQMDSGRWGNEFIPQYADFAHRTAKLFAGQDIVHVYQVWNEQDTRPEDGRAAVPIPAVDYAKMLTQTIQAIRSADPKAFIITGGHIRGAGEGGNYAEATIRAMPGTIRPDGIAFHPYGLGPSSSPYSIHGRLETAIERFGSILPGKPVWITEWGVLDRQDFDETEQVAQYAKGFLDIIRSRYNDRVAAAIWYAYAKGMDNGYGLVDREGRALKPLYDLYLKA